MGACIALRSIVKTPLGLFLFSYEDRTKKNLNLKKNLL